MPASTPWQWLSPYVFPHPSAVDACAQILSALQLACHKLALIRYVGISFIVTTLTFHCLNLWELDRFDLH